MIDTVFGIKVRMSGLSINRLSADNRPIVRRRLLAGRWSAIALSVYLYSSQLSLER